MIRRDIAYAARLLRKTPASAAIMILTLALGIGASAAVFSMVQAVLLRPLPYRDPTKLAVVWDSPVHNQGTKIFAPYRHFKVWRDKTQTFERLGAESWIRGPRFLLGRGAPQAILGASASVELFDVLGVPPQLGRTFTQNDVSQGCTVVLSHGFWQARLGGKPDAVGQQLTLEDASCTVVGIMPASFIFYPTPVDLWTLVTPGSELERNPDRNGVAVFGRLKPGISRATAEAELRSLARQIDQGRGFGVEVEPVAFDLQQEFTWLTGRNLRLSLIVLFSAVGFVLLIACVNVANLLLGRSLGRQREFAIRAALGSGRTRLVRQLLTENLLLSGLAAVLAIAFAGGAVHYFNIAKPVDLPPGALVELNLPVLAFTALLAVLTTVLSGFVPAWRAAKSGVSESLKSAGRSSAGPSRQRLARGLIAVQVALSLVLLAGAGLMIRSTMNFASAPLGFRPNNLTAMAVTLPRSYAKPEQRLEFYDQVKASILAQPGVEGVGLSTHVALRGAGGTSVLSIEGRPPGDPKTVVLDTEQQYVSDGYFHFLGMPVRRGRELAWADRGEQQLVTVVNEATVRKYFPQEDPIGKRIKFPGPQEPWLTIVGVVADEKQSTPFKEMAWDSPPIVYRALAQQTQTTFDVVFRGSLASTGVQQAVQALEPDARISEVETMDHVISRYLAYPQFRAVLMGGFAGLALLLAVVGLYGVLSQLVVQRTREIGIRMALGAQRGDVLGAIVKEGMLLAGIGVAVGLFAAGWLARFLSSLLYEVKAEDPSTLVGVAIVLMAAALLATYLPARRAARVDPTVSLRYE
jgi:predicted permease